jgi:hypothetical protein
MSRDTCLKRHLLHAAVQAYHPTPPFYSGPPRWTAGPVAIAPGRPATPDLGLPGTGIDYALVGRFDEGIVVAFRGTLPPLDLNPDSTRIILPSGSGPAIIRDWLNNFSPKPTTGFAIGDARLPGTVHGGFAGSLAKLWPEIAAEIDRLRSGEPAPRLYFTGHSKGGAVANLAAILAHLTWPAATIRAATFGAPRAGDRNFAREYAAAVQCHRYEVDGDAVPGLPPTPVFTFLFASWQPVGTPHPLPRTDRRDGPPLPALIAAHLPYRTFGYHEHVCEAGCRHDWL